MDVPTLDTWTTGQRVGARLLNDNTYRPAVYLDRFRPTGCIYLSSDWSHDGGDNEQMVPLDTRAWLTGMGFNSNALVVQEPGIYLVTGVVSWRMDTLLTTYAAGRAQKNGGYLMDYRDFQGSNLTPSSVAPLTFCEEVLLQKGDKITLAAYNPSTSTRDLAGATSREEVGTSCHLQATWVAHEDDSVTGALTSPRTWAPTDVPTAALLNTEVRDQWRYLLSPPRCKAVGSVSVPTSSETVVSLSSTNWDTDTSLASNALTFPVDGIYQVIAHGGFHAVSTAGRRYARVQYQSSGGSTIRSHTFQSAGNSGGFTRINGVLVVSASAGEKIQLSAYQDSGSTVNFNVAHLSYRWLGQVT